MLDLANAAAQFTYSNEKMSQAESLRRQFLERFPASGLGDLTLEKYSLGLEPKENSFCYWLEFKTYELGSIAGGSAYKFAVYFDKDEKKFKSTDKYKSPEDAFASVKSGILELVRLGSEGRFVDCENVPPFNTMAVIRGKILNMYYPEQFLPIFSLDHLKDFCLQFDILADYDSQTSMNLALLKFKQGNPVMTEWSNDKFMTFLYEKFRPTVQFWKIAPGENARLWQDCLRGNLICVGWGEIGDMRQETDDAAFKNRYRDIYGAKRIRQWKEIWLFAKEIKKGDIVVANNGLGAIVGIGTVTGDYWYDESREEYKHCVPVEWTTTEEFPVPESARDVVATWFQGTVKRLSRQEYNQLTSGKQPGTAQTSIQRKSPVAFRPSSGRYGAICESTFLDEKFFADCERLLKTKKQIILQGAPGTGKTFVAELLATLWAGDAKRVKVVQFHESYGYEDFVHGIRPQRDPVTQQTAFVPTPGLILNLCEEIEKDKTVPPNNYVLLIDEINRAKTARVFGELLYLLEYREKEVELQNGSRFSIPSNLYIIGTMNTTDKSIALVDYALRRRFAFVDLVPVKDSQSTVLGKWMESKGIGNAADVEQLFIALNNAVSQKDEALMVGHSYLMQEQAVDEKWFSNELLRFIWDYYIMPLIAEYEYQSSRAELEEKYGLAALRQSAN
jgi:5-methylcytosine-specific restriction protein B